MPPSEALVDDALADDDRPDATPRSSVNPRPATNDLWLANHADHEADPPAELRIDRSTRRAYVRDEELPLTTQLFDLLAFFLDHRGEAISFEDLAVSVWAYQPNVGDHHFLHTAVYRLRRILNDAGVEDLIDGIRGYGYRVKAGPAPRKEAVQEAPRAIAVFDPMDPDLRLAMVNEAAVQLTGYSVATLTNLRQAAKRLWDPEEREQIDAAVRETLESGSAKARGRHLIRADGTVILVDVLFSRLDLPGREPLCLAEVSPLT